MKGLKRMIKIRNQDGKVIYEREVICEVVTKFYEDLYRNINPYQSINKGNKISRATEMNKEEEWLKITRRNVCEVIERAKNSKIPHCKGGRN